LAHETHAFVKAVQVSEEPSKSVLLFISWNAMQFLCTVWKLILSGIDAADFGSLDQPILKSRTDDDKPLAATALPDEQQ
jgi:hypothetical protein